MNKYFWIHSEIEISHDSLKSIIIEIGNQNRFDKSPKISNYKIGLNTIQEELRNDSIPVSMTELKKFIKPCINFRNTWNTIVFSNKNSFILKVPFKSSEIFEKIMNIVIRNNNLLTICQTKYCPDFDPNSLCRTSQINNLYSLLDRRSFKLLGQQQVLYSKFGKHCLLSCNKKQKTNG